MIPAAVRNDLIAAVSWLLTLACSSQLTAQAVSKETFRLLPDDHVVFLGDGLIEQEQYHGYVEVLLTLASPTVDVRFRNLGWNADTPAGASRLGLSLLQAGYEPANEGWKQLQTQLKREQPSVAILGYGMASALEQGRAGLEQFIEEYHRLLQFLKNENAQIRLLLLSPLTRVEAATTTPRLPAKLNADLKAYQVAIEELAAQHKAHFWDLSKVALDPALRHDAVHLNADGYRALAEAMATALGEPIPNWQANEKLRQRIVKKNEWYFHRSRPANMAYVFGFRKREQGQNAVEIPQFDALIAKEEQVIRNLRSAPDANISVSPAQTKSRYAKFQPQPLPEFTTAEGLEITLWAENPLLNKPIQINFDTAGRLWVASSEAYPMIEVGQTANDRIIVLEDTDHDGTADLSTVFADGLLIPTGVLPSHDGVYVAQSTDLLFLQDTDGDGKADRKTRVLSGFGTEDTHHNLHTLRWGPDGRLYMNQSVYTRTNLETPRGVVRLNAGGGLRYQPDTMRTQLFFAGLWNSWGHQFDRYGRSFMSDGAGFSGLAYVFPGAQFRPVPGGQRQLALISPGNYPKFCSAEIVEGRSFPDDWQHSIITCDFRANRVTRFSLVEQGAGFETVQESDLLRTATATFRPIDVKQGPDGALYIADWSNPIINHGEVDFRDPRRDRWHGRIWRVAFPDRTNNNPVDFNQLSTEQLFAQLCGDDRYARDRARRVLLARNQETLSALPKWIQSQTDSFALLQGLWLYQGLRVTEQELLFRLLESESADVRAAATRVLADWSAPGTDCEPPMTFASARSWYQELLGDPHPRVQLEAIVGLNAQGTAAAVRLGLQRIDGETDPSLDRFLQFALTEMVADNSAALLPSLTKDPVSDEQLEFVLGAVKSNEATALLRNYLGEDQSLKGVGESLIRLIGKAGGTAELDRLFSEVLSGDMATDESRVALGALSVAMRVRKQRPSQSVGNIQRLFSHQDPQVATAAIQLAGLWKVRTLLGSLAVIANDPAELASKRLAAVQSLDAFKAVEKLTEIASKPGDQLEVTVAALAALSRSDPQAATVIFVAQDVAGTPSEDKAAIWRAVLSGKGSAKVLASKVAASSWDQDYLKVGLRIASEGGRKAPELVAALKAKLGESKKAITPSEVKKLAIDSASLGDPYRGEMIYREKDLACATCHAIAGRGGLVGPDLSSIGASAPIDYIAESLYFPNAKVKENYHSVVIVTSDGRQVTGVESAESNEQERVLRNAANEQIRIPRAEIEVETTGPSLMPAGLVERLETQQQLDLLRFLSLLGKPGDFDTSSRKVARNFQILAGSHRVEQQGIELILGKSPDQGKRWSEIKGRISGELPAELILAATKQPRNISLVNVYLKTYFELPANREVAVQVGKASAAWIDGTSVEIKNGQIIPAQVTGNQVTGKQELVLRFDARELPQAITVSSNESIFVAD